MVAYNPDNYQRRNVIVRGYLSLLPGDAWVLGDGGAQLLVVPHSGSEGLRELLGHRIEVTGIVRVLPTNQGTCNHNQWPGSKCDDPALPPIPDRRPEWPVGSITATRIVELDSYARGGPRRAASLGDVLASPAGRAGKSVRVVGQFRGTNLFGDLPAESRRDPDDWVLKDGEHALWITGKPPRGKGFDLDPANRSDTGRWLEVEGKLEVVGDLVYIKASRVTLVARPASPREEKP